MGGAGRTGSIVGVTLSGHEGNAIAGMNLILDLLGKGGLSCGGGAVYRIVERIIDGRLGAASAE